MQAGDKVVHKRRPDIGIGDLKAITCMVEFGNDNKFSGINIDSIELAKNINSVEFADKATICEKYIETWETFTNGLNNIFADIGEQVQANKIDLHETLKKLYGVPNKEIRTALQYPKVDKTSGNIGSVTGIFFEQIVTSLAVSYIKNVYPNAIISRNTCEKSSIVHGITRDPDLYIRENNKEVVIEMKVSPKKADLEYVKNLKEKFEKKNIGYFLVGGYVSADKYLLNSFNLGGWACFLEGSESNKDVISTFPTFTSIIANVNEFLKPS